MAIYYTFLIISKGTNIIKLNTISDNNYGIDYRGGDVYSFEKNNFINNNNANFSNNTAGNVNVDNNWWSTNVSSNIKKKIAGMTDYSNFTPYRLFGKYDITFNADTTNLLIVSNIGVIVSNSFKTLKWAKCNGGDFNHYNIYLANNDFINLSAGDIFNRQYLQFRSLQIYPQTIFIFYGRIYRMKHPIHYSEAQPPVQI